MSTPFSLSPAEAATKTSQIQDAMGRMDSTMNRVEASQEAIQKTWAGDKATQYVADSQKQNEDMKAYSQAMHSLVDDGIAHMHQFIAADN